MWHRGRETSRFLPATTPEQEDRRIETDRLDRRPVDEGFHLDMKLAVLGRGGRGPRVVFRGPDGAEVTLSEAHARAFDKPGWSRVGCLPDERHAKITFCHVDGRTMEMAADRAAVFNKPGWSRVDGAPRPPDVQLEQAVHERFYVPHQPVVDEYAHRDGPHEEPTSEAYEPFTLDRQIDRDVDGQEREAARRRRLAQLAAKLNGE